MFHKSPATPLATLQTEMRACRRCLTAGYQITPGAIFHGDAAARVLLIGQAPGVTEVEAQRPFNAGSGRRLFTWLQAAGWTEAEFRRRHYMTSVTKCYPGKSSSGKGDRVPSRREQALCRPFLERELALIAPALIIPVGGLAIKLFYPAGARLRDIIGAGAYFPPAALQDPANFDLRQAVRQDEFKPGLPPDGRWLVPLPHPSGASLWPNRPENKQLIARALAILDAIRRERNL